MSTIADIVAQHSGDQEALVTALLERENDMADALRLNAVQFGLYPEIVAEVLAALEMGSPISTEQRAMIHSNFHIRMERLSRGDFTL